jgi:class 3 adenylate cyclase
MRVCVVCGVENPDEARFCMRCAAALGAEGAERRERRVVSVLFADIVGYTARSERSDVEDVEDLLRGYYSVLRRDLERRGSIMPDPVASYHGSRAVICRCFRHVPA